MPPNFPLKALLVGTLSLGMTTAVYVKWPHLQQWILLGGSAILISVLADVLIPNVAFQMPVSNDQISFRGLVSFVVWFLLSSYIILRSWREYRRAQFPWHANRLLFWTIALLTTFLGEAFLFILYSGFTLAGQIIRFAGVAALAYAVASHRIIDVRTRSQKALAQIVLTLISALPMLAAIWAIQLAGEQLDWTARVTVLVVSITITAGMFFYQPFQRLVQRSVYRYMLGESLDVNRVLRHYSQVTSRTLDVHQLALVIINTISELLGTNRGALITLTETSGQVMLQPIQALGKLPGEGVTLPTSSLFVRSLRQQHQPLLQYELDFNPEFSTLSTKEKSWLKEMGMDVYVPIGTGEELNGLIVVGPKQSGFPYQPDELDLMQTLADQTVISLQNARLYSELGEQHDRIRQLNVDLVGQNERLEIMDRIKSDFITIASHELRTPLTQVKGYADILAAMNDEGILTRDQTREIVGHINRASLQLETLITAMLDASQIDAAGMQLTFMETTLETVLRLAADPLRNAMQTRRIHYEVHGMDKIPPLHADFKRLVQCFTNLIGNAIKYTPDHGTVSVSAHLLSGQPGESDHVEIIIADTGIGIAPKYHELIFEKFFRIGDPQLHSTGSTKFKGAGPGLGLPIARGVIEAHHGRIWVESTGEDEIRLPGSQFHVILPLQPPDLPATNGRQRHFVPSYSL
ncbi:MAG: GAF domain-containing protein [Anaerolineales bacterium]|nr:GAF domain-containing protein [Anaerolineales bacterium]